MGRRRHRSDGPTGLLLVDKPDGITSAAVVGKVRRFFGGPKTGHTGTLDPFATGLLPVCLGEATKAAGYLTGADKAYEGTIRLGLETDTLDRTGTVTSRSEVPAFGDERLEEVAAGFRGEIEQVPPSFSAIKREGTPMYELARKGRAPELDPRPVRVGHLELAVAGPDTVRVSIVCSKGFYVRSLARDVGAMLGCGAVLDELRRTRVGHLRVEDAIPLADLLAPAAEGPRAEQALLGLDEALAHLARVDVAPSEAAGLRQGRQNALWSLRPGAPGERVRVGCRSDLVAVAAFEQGRWSLERVFAAAAPMAQRGACPPPGSVLPPADSPMEEEERNEANRRD